MVVNIKYFLVIVKPEMAVARGKVQEED